MKYTLNAIKSVQKKELLKNHLGKTAESLNSIDFEILFPHDYISPAGNTVKDFKRIVDRITHCSEHATMQETNLVDKKTGEIIDKFKMVESNRCNVYTLCPVCASAKRSKIINELRPYIDCLKDMNINFYMGTITIENSTNPEKAYDKLRKAWTDFNKLGQKRGASRSGGEASKIIGSLLSIETIEGAVENSYHVHGHVLIVSNEKINYKVYDQEKKKELEMIYGSSIPENELLKIVTDYEYGKNGQLVPLSKLTREWFNCSGAFNFFCKPIKEGFFKGKYQTIEDHLHEVIKYECKPWELKPEKLIILFDSITGKKRITKAGIFLKRNRSRWYRMIIKSGLKNKWKNITKELNDEDNEDFQVIDKKIYSLNYQDLKYTIKDEQDYSKYVIYKTVKKDYDTQRAKALNEFRSAFSILKKLIGAIKNSDWIERKENIRNYFTGQNRKLKAKFLFELGRAMN